MYTRFDVVVDIIVVFRYILCAAGEPLEYRARVVDIFSFEFNHNSEYMPRRTVLVVLVLVMVVVAATNKRKRNSKKMMLYGSFHFVFFFLWSSLFT